MRQAGYKPKSHDSGVYWVRANANTGGQSEYKPEPSLKKFFIIVFAVIFIFCALV